MQFVSVLKIISSPILSKSKPLFFFGASCPFDAARASYIHAVYNHLFFYAIYVDPFASYLFTYTPHARNNISEGK